MPPRYIFCISTGRSGTNYLQSLLASCEGVTALHEPAPRCFGPQMADWLRGRPRRMEAVARDKARVIRRHLEDSPVYAETNHAFIKGFGWYMPELLGEDQIAVVVLERDKEEVGRSFLRRRTTPLTKSGRKYLICPDRKDPLVRPPGGRWPRLAYWFLRLASYPFRARRLYSSLGLAPPAMPGVLTRYEEACLRWYSDETFALAEAYRKRFPAVRMVHIRMDRLNDPEQVAGLLQGLGLRQSGATRDLVGRRVNASPPRPARTGRRRRS